jgi:cytochrome bd-type quinol oxidase subunit 1
MKYLAMATAGAVLMATCLLAMSAGATSVQAAGATEAKPIVVAQMEKKETTTEKVKRKVKRAWRNMTGTQYDVACPAILPISHSTCTETGSRNEARAKCQSKNPLCSVSAAK